MRVLHIDTGPSWRGGQRQTLLHLIFLKEQGCSGLLLARPLTELWHRARTLNIPCFPWPRGDGRLKALRILGGIHVAHKPQITQINDARGLLPAMLLKTVFKETKTVAVRRAAFHLDLLSLKCLYAPADCVLCISAAIRQQMQRNGLSPSKLHTIFSGVDLEALKQKTDTENMRRSLQIPKNAIHVGHIGHLSHEKGQAVLLRAAHRLKPIPNLFFSFLGDGPLLPELKDLASRLGIRHQTRFPGHHSNIGDYLASLDIYVQPSLSEGLGSSVIDAMGAGLPIIGSDVGGIPELVKDGVGLLVAPGNLQSLAGAIAHLARQPEKRLKIGKKALVRAQNFDFRKTNAQLLELYQRLLG